MFILSQKVLTLTIIFFESLALQSEILLENLSSEVYSPFLRKNNIPGVYLLKEETL